MTLPLTDIATALIGGLTVILIVLTIIYVIQGSKDKGQKDTFTVIPDGATVTGTGAITAPAIYTNGLIRGDPKTLVDQAKATGTVSDTSCMIMGATNCKDDINQIWQNQCAIQEIDDKASQGFQSTDDIKAKTQYLMNNNNCQGLFKRNGIVVAGTVIVMPGFAFDNTKAIDNVDQGFCPAGGVNPATGAVERHKKRTIKSSPIVGIQDNEVTETAETKLLKDNGVLSA